MIHGLSKTTSSPRIAKRQQERREEIIHAALGLCQAHGLGGLTAHQLSQALDMTPGALYRYFPSIAALIAACELDALQKIGALIHSRMTPKQGALAPLNRLIAASKAYCDARTLMPAHMTFLRRLLGDPNPLVTSEDAQPLMLFVMELLAPINDAFAAASEAGLLTPMGDEPRALMLFGALSGVLQLDKVERYTAHKTHLLAWQTTRALMLGWGANATQLERAHEEVS